MMRWLKEFLEPTLKCARLGHASIREDRIVMRRCTGDEYRRAVVMKAQEMRTRCGRCEVVLVEPYEVDASPISSWSAPQSVWDEFESTGRHVSRGWRRLG